MDQGIYDLIKIKFEVKMYSCLNNFTFHIEPPPYIIMHVSVQVGGDKEDVGRVELYIINMHVGSNVCLIFINLL